ncbi:MAG: PA2779 family protein [Rhodospirillales bacterium]|nr:PA2779 family protein [Rhodospirillales bacterium]MDH3793067.1 PA2779 family protein [Rhodospirillales bacterium]MDH3911363.1 PA2779 family protein [Rhodospirillales bacterium]MDH3920117.1 PA2779 family protein [Rhodospirillales bacterium]MDH3967914.1 PA2779 family protein [Rhodospirillales bacterium]
MMNLGQSARTIALAMAVVMLATSLPINFARAAIVTTEEVVAAQAADEDRARVIQFMAREDVRRQIEALGIDPDEAARRTESLSDEEIQQIAGRLDELPAGQDVVVVLLAAGLALFLLLIITDLLGYTDVFPFIKAQTK